MAAREAIEAIAKKDDGVYAGKGGRNRYLHPETPRESGYGTQRHSPSPPGASALLGVERSRFIWAQPSRISTARDPEPS